ncbi:MAG: hypothetical protein ACFFDF_04710 [Candidatus Odinarchaeota archaeon]
MRQGEVEEIANKKGAELREMIIDLFRLNIIDDALSFLDTEFKAKRHEKENLEKNRVPIKRIKEDIDRIENENDKFEKEIIDKKKEKGNLSKKIENFPSNKLISEIEKLYNQKNSSKDKFQSYYDNFLFKLKKIDLNLADFDSQDNIINKINILKSNKKEFQLNKEELQEKSDATFKGLGKTKGRIEDIKKSMKKMETSLKFTKKGSGKEIAQCPTCQSELTKEHYNEIIQKFTDELKINQKKVDDISKIVKNFDEKIKSNQLRLDQIKELIIIHQNLKTDFENYKKYELELNKIESELKAFLSQHGDTFKDSSIDGIKKLAIEKEKASTELNSIQNELNEKEVKFQGNIKRREELYNEIQKMAQIQKNIDQYEIDLEHITKAKEFVRRFVTEYMVVKRLVKNIAFSTDKYIKDFTSGQYSDLLLDLSGTKKTGLSLRIKDNFNGEYESIEALSGGDRTALGIALRLSISELMSSIRPTKESPRKNPKIDFLLLDEPLAALDETRRERILKRLTKSKSFSQIFLITHTAIPQDINASKVIVEKDLSTGISRAKFEKPTIII